MIVRHILAFCLLTAPVTGAPAAQAPAAPAKRTLTIPIGPTAARAPTAPAIDCLIAVGPAVSLPALAFAPDGKTLAVGGYQEVALWDLAEPKLARRFAVGQTGQSVQALRFTKDGKTLLVAEGAPHGAGAVRTVAADSGKTAHTFQGPKDVVYCLALSADEKLLAAGGADGQVHVWTLADKKLVATVKEHVDWIHGVAFSPDGKLLATASADRSAILFEVEGWKPVNRFQFKETVYGVAFNADGDQVAMVVGGPEEKGLRIRNVEEPTQPPKPGAKPARPPRTSDTGAGMPLDAVWFAPNDRVYMPCSDGMVRVYEVAKSFVSGNLAGHADWVYRVAVSPDGSRFASGSADGTVKLWNVADNRLLATLVQLAPQSDGWAVVTALGYFNASAPDAVEVKLANIKMPPEEVTQLLKNPDLVRQAVAAEKVAPPAVK